jgi:hypothetical protein
VTGIAPALRHSAKGTKPEWLVPRNLGRGNIRQAIRTYTRHVDGLKLGPVAALRGQELLRELKRGKTDLPPYPNVSWFEAANRIMTDLVTLYGARWLLTRKDLPFDSYDVQYGNEGHRSFDIEADHEGTRLIGEVFNVANSFLATKTRKACEKLTELGSEAEYRLILLNADCANRLGDNLDKRIALVGVDVKTGECSLRRGDLRCG